MYIHINLEADAIKNKNDHDDHLHHDNCCGDHI